jgi:Na+-driven multidrug efflux pump
VGQFVGERRWVEAQNTVKSVLGLILPFMCGMGLIFLIWGEALMGLFLKESDPVLRDQILSMGGLVALAIAVWQIGDAFQVTYRHCLRATGDHKWVMWAGISLSWLLNIPIVAITIFWFEGTVFHSWLVFSVEIYFGAWIFHRRWKSGVWREKRLVR